MFALNILDFYGYKTNKLRTIFGRKDETWAMFSALDVGVLACHAVHAKQPNLKLKTQSLYLVGYLL